MVDGLQTTGNESRLLLNADAEMESDYVAPSNFVVVNSSGEYTPLGHYEHLVKKLDDLLLRERLPQVLRALSASIQNKQCGLSEVFTSLRFVVWWVRQSAGQGQSLGMYREYAKYMYAEFYLDQIPSSVRKTNAQMYAMTTVTTVVR